MLSTLAVATLVATAVQFSCLHSLHIMASREQAGASYLGLDCHSRLYMTTRTYNSLLIVYQSLRFHSVPTCGRTDLCFCLSSAAIRVSVLGSTAACTAGSRRCPTAAPHSCLTAEGFSPACSASGVSLDVCLAQAASMGGAPAACCSGFLLACLLSSALRASGV